jgi:hypothetical protein
MGEIPFSGVHCHILGGPPCFQFVHLDELLIAIGPFWQLHDSFLAYRGVRKSLLEGRRKFLPVDRNILQCR